MKKIYNLIMLVIAISCLVIAYNIYQGKQREYHEAERQEELKRQEEEERLRAERQKQEAEQKQMLLEIAEKKKKVEEETRIKQEQADSVKSGNELLKAGNYEGAIVKFNRAIELGVPDADIYNGLGICYEKIAKTEQASVYYKKALEIKPEFKEAEINIKNLEHQILKLQITDELKPLFEVLKNNQAELEKCQAEIQAVEKEVSGLPLEIVNLTGGKQMRGIILEEITEMISFALNSRKQVTIVKMDIESINRISSEEKVKVKTLWKKESELKEKNTTLESRTGEIKKKITELQSTLNKSYYDLQDTKGLVVYEGKWVTPDEKVKLEDEKKKSEEAKKTTQDYTPLAKIEPVKPKLYSFTNDKSGLVNLILNLVPQPPGADVTYDTTYQSLLVTNTQANLKPVDEIVGKSDNPTELQGTIEKLLWANGRYQNSRYGFQIEKPAWGLTTTFTVPGSVVSPPYGATCQFGMTLQVGKSNIRFLVYQLKEPTTSQDYALARKNHPEPEFANGWIDKKKEIFRDGVFFGIKDSYRTTDLWSTGQKEFICSRVHLVKGHTLYEIVQICTPQDFQNTEEQTLFSFVKCLKFFQPVIPDKRVKQESTIKLITKVTISEGDPYKKDLETARSLMENKEYTQAIQILEQVVVKKDAGTRGEEALFQIGYVKGFSLKEYDSAIKTFEEFKKRYPKSASIEDADRTIPVLYFKKKEYETAEEKFLELLEKYPTKETANFIKHYLYLMKNCGEKKI